MTPDDFRRIALGFSGAEERSHMGHPDFRAAGRIFATLGSPNAEFGMVKLTPEEQQNYLGAAPGAFTPASGAWGRQGCTLVRLDAAPVALVRKAVETAWRSVQERKPAPTRARRRAKSSTS